MDHTLRLPGGGELSGDSPVVVIGPNGSGKTRKTREIAANDGSRIEFINALRSTRVPPDLQMATMTNADQNFENTKAQTRDSHWEMATEFDWMLTRLIAQDATSAIQLKRDIRINPDAVHNVAVTPLDRLQAIWSTVFEGREIWFPDWRPTVTNTTSGSREQYTGNTMSDGEKAALFLIGRILLITGSHIVVIDEPETHLHTLLAVRLWDALEQARPDMRFVYVTHDLTFALSRQHAQFVLASTITGVGLRPLGLDTSTMPPDVAEALLGSASLSIYASRVVFCEGDQTSYDARLYKAWFNGRDTVVRPVSSSGTVIRCVEAMNKAGIFTGLSPIGIVDSDYHPDRWKTTLAANISVLPVHEVESIFATPNVVAAVCQHTGSAFNAASYLAKVKDTVRPDQQLNMTIDRWKFNLEPRLTALMNQVSKSTPIEGLVAELPVLFDYTSWDFSPQALLEEERDYVDGVLENGSSDDVMRLVPGKQLLRVAADAAGMTIPTYVNLIVTTVAADDVSGSFAPSLIAAIEPLLPARYAQVVGLPTPST